jgi:MoxR-like ATPase
MLSIVERTRTHESLALGVSPRGSQAFYRAVQAHAVADGRTFALPDDVKALAPKVFGHRVVPATRSALAARRNANSAASGERIIEEILSLIPVPL